MKLKLEVELDNAAFDEPGEELARILRLAAKQVESLLGSLAYQHGTSRSRTVPVRDVNGNRVGAFSVVGGRRRR